MEEPTLEQQVAEMERALAALWVETAELDRQLERDRARLVEVRKSVETHESELAAERARTPGLTAELHAAEKF